MRPADLALTLLCTLGAAAGPAAAVEPVTVHHGRYTDFAGGSGQGVALGGDGVLTLAPVLRPLADTGAERIWDLLAAGDVLWIATGDGGKVYTVTDGAEPRLLFDSPEVGVQALAAATAGKGSGAVFAGTSPDGLVYRIAADGAAAIVARTEARYVWDLAVDGKGLLVATGAPARVLRVEGERSDTWLTLPGDGHVRALVRGAGTWFAGTAGDGGEASARGRIYALDGSRSRLVVETDYEEIAALAASGDTLFAAVTTTPAGDPSKAPPARSALLRVEPGGAAYPLWQGEGVAAGLLGPEAGSLTLLLREPGRVLRLRTDGAELQRRAAVDSLVPAPLARWRGGLVLGDGRSGRLWALGDAPADSGWFDAPVVDLGAHGDWGAIDWEADVPRGASVALRTRSGNSAEPDEHWSAWSTGRLEPGDIVASPAGRYLQYRLVLRGRAGAEPSVRRISITGRQTNLPPRIDELTTFAYRGNPQAPGPPPPQPAGNGGNGNRSLPQSKSLRLVRWQASDANDDQLRYAIYLRGVGQRQWKLVEQDIDQTTVFWDTAAMPEGLTQLRLVANDAFDNPPTTALQAEAVTEPFPIDNSPPVVVLEIRHEAGAVVVEARLTDAVTSLVGARCAVDYADDGPRLAPADGLFDSRHESASVRLTDLEPGEHVVAVQAWDQLDNVGVAQTVVTVEDPGRGRQP